ncbi:hypothetical protein Hamer_G021816 [Homarus americanus]|uniref:Uncharacterized protein n=1 Tax=Homarus americanus TaxID=6706 RepID=A0A8J5N860_HOMAM|nr:hypothetical protein Hamer_G021816 [Homarus americanus]
MSKISVGSKEILVVAPPIRNLLSTCPQKTVQALKKL